MNIPHAVEGSCHYGELGERRGLKNRLQQHHIRQQRTLASLSVKAGRRLPARFLISCREATPVDVMS